MFKVMISVGFEVRKGPKRLLRPSLSRHARALSRVPKSFRQGEGEGEGDGEDGG